MNTLIELNTLVYCLAAGRMILGLAPIIAAEPLSKLLGFPEAHNNPSTRLFARLFGVRDIGLGILVIFLLKDIELLRWGLIFNAFHDLADIGMIAIPLWRKQGMKKAALLCMMFACGGLISWLLVWKLSFFLA